MLQNTLYLQGPLAPPNQVLKLRQDIFKLEGKDRYHLSAISDYFQIR